MEETANIPRQAKWAQFLRNHDEIDLARLTNKQRNKVYEAFGPEKNMQLYDQTYDAGSLPAIGWGAWQVLPSGSSHVLILQYNWEGQTILTMHNLSPKSQEVTTKPQTGART